MPHFLVLVSLLLAAFIHLGSGEWCVHVLNDDRVKIYNVTDNTMSVLDSNNWNYTMNTCHATTCGSFTNCQICQFTGGSYQCTASAAGVYSALPSSYSSYIGYKMFFYGDAAGCPNQKKRQSTVFVLCNTGTLSISVLGEPVICEYEFEIRLPGQCTFLPPVPTLSTVAKASNSISMAINQDYHLSHVDYLTIQYQAWMNNAQVYSGNYPGFIVDQLPAATSYNFTAKAIYNGQSSAISPALNVVPDPGSVPDTVVIEEMITELGNQLSQTGDKIQNQVGDVEGMLTEDVVDVLRHTDDQTVDIAQQLTKLNNNTLADMNAKINQLLGKSSGGSSGGALVAIGIVVGIVIGVIGTIVVCKYAFKIDIIPKGKSNYGRVSANKLTLHDDEEGLMGND